MKISKYLFLFIVVGFLSCSEDNLSDTGDLTINFKLEYDGAPVVMFDNYVYPDGQDFFFSRFSFYMADIDLGSGAMDRVHYVNPTNAHSTMAGAMEGYDFTLRDIAVGNYTQLAFDIGVPESQNATAPADYSSDNDLSLASEYWSPWGSYIFSKTEAKLDNDGDGINETSIALHIGSDEALRSVNMAKNFTIGGDGTEQIDVVIDLKKVFDGDAGVYDIIANPSTHQLSQNGPINEIADNISKAFQ